MAKEVGHLVEEEDVLVEVVEVHQEISYPVVPRLRKKSK